MQELMDFMEAATAEVETIRQEVVGRGRTLLKTILKELFDKNPQLTHIMWNQYTPYFNDGDVCHFGVGEVVFSRVTAPMEDGYVSYYHNYDDSATYGVDTYYNRYDSAVPYPPEFEAFQTLLRDYAEELMRPLFGDHVFVVIRRTEDGRIEQLIDEYEHD